jgi:hypothetical protein
VAVLEIALKTENGNAPMVFVLLAAFIFGTAALAQQTPTMVHAGLRTLYLAGLHRMIVIFKANGVEVSYQELESGALSPAAIIGAGACHERRGLSIAPLAKQGKVRRGLQPHGPHDHESRRAQ